MDWSMITPGLPHWTCSMGLDVFISTVSHIGEHLAYSSLGVFEKGEIMLGVTRRWNIFPCSQVMCTAHSSNNETRSEGLKRWWM